MKSIVLFVVFSIENVHGCFKMRLPPDLQLKTYSLYIDDENVVINDQLNPNYNQNRALTYGVWTQYNPLQQIAQAASLGLVNNNCFSPHHLVESKSKNINFLYYDCLDYQKKQITKNIRFKDHNGEEHVYEIRIGNDKYESYWYFFEINVWPSLNLIRMLIFHDFDKTFFQNVQIKFPYYDKNLTLIFGGGVDVFNALSQGYYFSEKIKFFSFPGETQICPPSFEDQNPEFSGIHSFTQQIQCKQNTELSLIKYEKFGIHDFGEYSTGYPNTVSFLLAGWIKITSIVYESKDLTYKLLKLTTNSQNKKLTNDNLSPFCLLYHFSDSGNRIIFTTYSYTFPSINIDFTDNPYLITQSFDLTIDILLWHYINVELSDNILSVTITFYDEFHTQYQKQLPVVQFQFIVFQLQVGNIEGLKDKYFEFEAAQFQFSNCNLDEFFPACDHTCLDCNGPTYQDCLSCSQDSNRYYLEQLQQCACPFETIDDYQCLTYQDLNLEVLSDNQINYEQTCSFGYFRIDDECYLCPSIINSQQITCLDCLVNPLTWINILYCSQSLISMEGLAQQNIYETRQYFIYDGINLNYCSYCTDYCQDEECINNHYKFTNQPEIKLCSDHINLNCYYCDVKNCLRCDISLNGLIVCTLCDEVYALKNGECFLQHHKGQSLCFENCSSCNNVFDCQLCFPPYYLTSDKSQCKLCNIQNCFYCFEYQSNDRTQNTLQQDFQTFQFDENTKVGCSLCFDGFNFDFISEKCIYGLPQIKNCLRYFRDVTTQEVCLLSAIDDFDIAPQIINCQLHIENCEQCILTPSQIIKCIICANGYTSSFKTGLCKKCDIQYAIKCIDGTQRNDYWIQLIQSFLIQFLPDKYIYSFKSYSDLVKSTPLQCYLGYKLTRSGICAKYCDSDCLLCEEVDNESFFCKRCPISYYGLKRLSVSQGSCLVCPQLCLICKERTPDDIAKINSDFLIHSSNVYYTHQCLQAVADEKVVLDSNFYIAKYCFDQQCIGQFGVQLNINNCFFKYLVSDSTYFYENSLDFDYCNRMGIVFFQVRVTFICNDIFQGQVIKSFLRKSIFQLQQTKIFLIGTHSPQNVIQAPFTIENYDIIEWQLIKYQGNQLTFLNADKPIDLIFTDIIFSGNFKDFEVFIQCNSLKNIRLKKLQFVDLNLTDLIWLNYQTNIQNTTIIIEDLTIQHCVFENVTLFSIHSFSVVISIQNINIIQSLLIQTTLFKYDSINQFQESSDIDKFFISDSNIEFSTLIIHNGGRLLKIQRLLVENCLFNQSIIIKPLCNTILTQISIIKVQMLSSFLLKADVQESFLTKLIYDFSNFFIKNSTFANNSVLVYIHQLKTNVFQINIKLNYFEHFDLIQIGEINQDNFLYDLKCYDIKVQNLSIQNSFDLSYFNIQQTQFIQISGISYLNLRQKQKIQLSMECYDNLESIATLIQIQGYTFLLIEKIQIYNQFSVDRPLINILSDIFFNQNQQEIVKISQINFFGNILIKRKLAHIFSLLVIYSNRPQNIALQGIKFVENFFNQLIDDPSQSAASLIYIDSQLSHIFLEQISCFNNGLTNSSFSFILTHSLSIKIEDLTAQNKNILSDQLWSQYYQLNTQNGINITSSLTQKLIEQIYGISNVGGIGKIITSEMFLDHANFNNVLSEKRSIFDITTQGQGNVFLNNIYIENVQSVLQSNLITDGCITVSSQNSNLNLSLYNLFLKEIKNRLDPAIFTIYPSKKQNYIQFSNISVIDCFSLINSFIFAEFSKESSNQLIFKNVSLNNSQDGLKKYLQQIQFPNSIEIAKMKSANAFFNLINCKIIFDKFFITGMLISPILILRDSWVCRISNFKVINVKLLYPFSVLQFNQIDLIKSTFIFENLEIFNATQIQQSEFDASLEKLTQNLYIFHSFLNCFIQEMDLTRIQVNQTISALIASLNQDMIYTGSILQINGISKQTNVKIHKLNILQNDCNFCYDGMVSVQSIEYSRFIIEDLRCLSNNIMNFGCLQLKSNKKQPESQLMFLIKHSFFIKNNGLQGSGIFAQNLFLKIVNSTFMRNFGSDKGGAIFLNTYSQDFQIFNSFFIENIAPTGGGIYLGGESQLTLKNWYQSITQFNKANFYTNNLVEAPDHLSLSINNQKIKSIIKQNGHSVTQIIQLQPYKFFNKSNIYTSYLYLPSGQEIISYKLYDEKNRIFVSYIQEISVLFKNSLNENLIGDPSDECIIYTNNPEGIGNGIENQKLGIIKFNSTSNKFDLGGLKITYNPYDQFNQYLIIYLECKSNIAKKQLNYQIKAKTFPCQLGEFFTNNQCLICESTFGFYSVTQNATSCSIFDSSKFQKITSNQIKLNPSYWRPSYNSNSVQYCFKNQQYCQGGWGVGNDLCFTGHIGGLCEECDTYNIRGNGFYVKTSFLECGACTGSQIQKLPFTFLLIWSFISMIFSLKSNKNTNKTFAKLRVTTKLYDVLFKLTQNFESILLKIFLNYLWIFSAISTFDITFDFSLNAVNSISTPSAAVANNMDCELSQISEIQLIYVRLISMISFFLIQISVICIGMKIYTLLTKSPFETSTITNSFLYLFLSNQSALMKSLSSLIAVRIISEKEYIQGNVSLEFYKDNHIQWIFYFILPCLLIFGLLIPFVLFLILYFNKNKFNQVKFRKHLGYLFNEYNNENQFWEQARTLQRTLIIIFLTYFETNVYLKASLISLAVLFYQLLALSRKPYIIRSLNILDIQSAQLILITILSALIKYISEQNADTLSSAIFQVIIILLLLQLSLKFISRIAGLYYKKYQLQILKLLKNLSSILGNFRLISNFLSQKYLILQGRKEKLEKNFEKLRALKNKRKIERISNYKLSATGLQRFNYIPLSYPNSRN